MLQKSSVHAWYDEGTVPGFYIDKIALGSPHHHILAAASQLKLAVDGEKYKNLPVFLTGWWRSSIGRFVVVQVFSDAVALEFSDITFQWSG